MDSATTAEKMRRIYIILRWYDRYVDWVNQTPNQEIPDDDVRLALQLGQEMIELQHISLNKEKEVYAKSKQSK
jgi:hypothetical protein